MKLLIYLVILIFTSKAMACTCAIRGELSIRDYHKTPVIFSGLVIGIEKNTSLKELEYNNKEVTLRVIQYYKGGNSTSEIIKVYTSFWDASCGLGINENDGEWIIFAYEGPNGLLITNMCTPSLRLKSDAKSSEFITKLQSYKEAEGFKEFFNTNGEKSAEGRMINNIPDGYWIYYPGLLTQHEAGFYKNGQRDSIWTSYFQGKVNKSTSYKNGLKDGVSINYQWENNIPESIKHYSNDTLNGPALTFYKNGMLMIKGQYDKGIATGEWSCYDEEGNLVCSAYDLYIWRNTRTGMFSCE